MDTRKRAAGVAAVTGVAVAAALVLRRRRWQLGLAPVDPDETLPGDEVVGQADYRATRGIDIDVPPESVWPWLVQLGQGRGGLYSYDRLENLLGLDIHSVDTIVPELQDVAVGDRVRLVPEGTEPDLAFTVLRLEPPEVLLLGADGSPQDALDAGLPYPTWVFVVRPRGDGGSRLVVRFQAVVPDSAGQRLAYRYLLGPAHYIMERRMLLGIKQRAEGSLPG